MARAITPLWRVAVLHGPTGKNADPEFTRARARKAVAARESTDNLVRKLIERAEQLTPEQLDKLAALLPGGRSA
jgi:hypothetical protein